MKLLPVQILLVVIGGVNSIIDNIFAGNFIGPEAMAATGLFAPANNFLNAVNALLFGGSQIVCGKYLGKNMAERTSGVFTMDMIAMTGISVVFTLVCEMFPGTAASALGASGELNASLSQYITGFSVGLPAFCLGTQLTAFLQLERKEKLSYIGIAAMFAANIFFNWLFISELKMGFLGLGLSTSIGNVIFFLIQFAHYITGRSSIKLSVKEIVISDLPEVLKNGLPGALTQLCIFLRGIIVNALIQNFVGQDGLSAYSSIQSFGAVYWAVPAGVTAAVTVLASIYIGEEDRASLIVLMKTFIRRGVGLVLLVSVIYSALCVPLTNIFFHDPQAPVYSMTIFGFMLFPLSSPLSAVTVGFSNCYQCLKHYNIVRAITVVDGLVAMSVLSLLLVPSLGMMGVWIAQIFAGVVLVSVIFVYSIIYNRSIPTSLEKMICIPEDLGSPDDSRIDISIKNMDDVTNVSEMVWNFCRSHGIDDRRTNCASLCVEELAGNIIRHGSAQVKNPGIDIRISYIKDNINIGIKDNCKAFNPKEAAGLFLPEDVTHNIGLRIVSRISKSMSYQNTLGLNMLTIVV